MNPELQYVIWSEEHGAWWAHERNGYTRYLTNAGRYSKAQAHEIVTHANQYLHPPAWNEIAIPDPLNPNTSAQLDALLGLQAIIAARPSLQSSLEKPSP